MLVLFLGPELRHRPGRQVPAHRAADAGRRRAAAAVHLRGRRRSAAATGRSSAPCCCWSRRSLIAIVLEPGVSFTTLLVVAAVRRRRRRQLRLLDDQHQRLLPGPAQGLGARPQRRRRQPRRARWSSWSACWCWPPSAPSYPRLLVGDLHPADRAGRGRRGAVHGQPDPGPQRASGAMREVTRRPAHLDHVAALHRHLRLVHRLRLRLRPGAAGAVRRRASRTPVKAAVR